MMSVKSRVLEIMEKNRSKAISGQELADYLSVSRAAIWKAIRSLKEEGYQIEATTNKGYLLMDNNDILSGEGIKTYLQPEYQNNPVIVYKQIDSTNLEGKKIAAVGTKHGTVILAEEQTEGRGRLGRSFYSPAQTGIYMSIILKPQKSLNDFLLITVAAAVGVCRVIKKLTDKKPQIKWVNDIFLDNKKICGILTEAVSNFEIGMVESVILGIGINIKTNENQFPEELREIAGSLFSEGITRNQIAAEIINEIMKLSENLEDKTLIEEYKKYSLVLGKIISYNKNGEIYTAKAIDINNQGNLVVENEQGETYIIQSGEVSIGSGQILGNSKHS